MYSNNFENNSKITGEFYRRKKKLRKLFSFVFIQHEFVRHPAGETLLLNHRVSLLRAFFVTSSSSTSTKTVSEPTSPNVLFPTTNSSLPRPKPSDSIIIRDGNTTNRIYEPTESPFASGNEQRSLSIFHADSPVISSSEAGFDTDQQESPNDLPPRLLSRQNAVLTSTEKLRRRGVRVFSMNRIFRTNFSSDFDQHEEQ